MKPSERPIQSPSRAAIAMLTAFVFAIFIGNVWLGIVTLPLSMLILPLLICFQPQALRPGGIPLGAYCLLALLAVVGLQLALGLSLNPRSDLAIWTPILFAGASMLAVRYLRVSDELLGRTIVWGALVSGLIMAAMMVFAPPRFFLIPGQDQFRIEASSVRPETNPSPPVAAPGSEPQVTSNRTQAAKAPGTSSRMDTQPSQSKTSVPTPSAKPQVTREEFLSGLGQAGDSQFYSFKEKASNALGRSNYIAAFFVFGFTVALFGRMYGLAAVLGGTVILTLSRFGFLFLGMSLLAYLAHRRGISAGRIAVVGAVTTTGTLLLLVLLRPYLDWLPGIQSLDARLLYWSSALDVFKNNIWLGIPRSDVLANTGFTLTWNPHSSILYVGVYFGVLGLAAYAVYVFVTLAGILKISNGSSFWTSIFIGLVLLFLWSLVEIIVLTPAFEILLATLYALAWARSRGASVAPTYWFRRQTPADRAVTAGS